MVASRIVYVQLFLAVKMECSAVSLKIEVIDIGCGLTVFDDVMLQAVAVELTIFDAKDIFFIVVVIP